MDLLRRSIISSVALGLLSLAGCSSVSDSSSDNVVDITVYNETDQEVSVRLDVVRASDGKQLIDDSFTLSSKSDGSTSSKEYTEVVSGSETAAIHVTVQNGPEGRYEFTDEAKTDAKGVHIEITADAIQFTEVVA